jgi:hypothetical protein
LALSSPGWRERDRQAVVLGVFSVGLVFGGVLSSLVLWLLSGLAAPLPATVRYGLIVGFALAGVLRDAGVVRFPLPQNTRQVPQDVLRRDVVRGALRFGFELGTGVRTYVSSTVPYVLAASLLLSTPGFGAAVLAGAGFGLGRATTPLARFASGTGQSWDAALHARLRVITVGGGAVVAVILGWLAHHAI